MLRRVPQATVAQAWVRCLPAMIPALRRSAGQLDAASVLFALDDGSMQLWIDEDRDPPVSAVTGVTDYPGVRVLVVALLAGREIGAWLSDVEAAFIAYASEQGCTALECCVRPGLVGARYDRRRAVLKRWRPHATVVRLPI